MTDALDNKQLERAREDMTRGRFGAALEILRRYQPQRKHDHAQDHSSLLSEALHMTGEHDAAARSVADGLRSCGRDESRRASFLTVRALLHFERGDTEGAIETFRKADVAARKGRDLEQLCRIQLESLATLADSMGPDSVASRLPECRQTVARVGRPHFKARFHLTLGQIEGKRGLLDQALAHLRLAARAIRENRNIWLEGLLKLNLSTVHALKAEDEEGLRFAEDALRCAESSCHRRTKVAAIGNLAYLNLWRHDLSTAERHCREGLRMAASYSDVRIALTDTLAQTMLVSGRYSECRQLVEVITKDASADSARWYRTGITLTDLRLRNQASDWSGGAASATSSIVGADARRERLHQVSLRVLGADALIELERFDEAAVLINDAAQLAQDVPLATYAEVERVSAALSARTVGRESARRQFERALRILGEVGGIAPRMDAMASYGRTMRPTNAQLQRELDTQPWRVEPVVGRTLPGQAGHTLETAARGRTFRGIEVGDIMVLGRLVWRPTLLAQEVFVLLRESGHVSALAIVQRSKGRAERVLAHEGWSAGEARNEALQATASRAIDIGGYEGKTLEVLARPADDVRDVAFVRHVDMLVQEARALKASRDTERAQLSLMSLEDESEKDGLFLAESMREIVTMAKQVAKSRLPVLITGETGTGKEVLARLVHKLSDRADRDFVPYNCAGVPKDMVESQLFGHRRGSFTGASEDSPGVIRAANRGTLLLDEIGEVELAIQPKLLRFLDNREVQPLGESRPVTVDVRVIAATNANLEELVRDGLFREDLLYRLNIITLDLPPLRNRREEILPLAHHLLDEVSREDEKPTFRLTEDAEKCLLCYEWPGNVRRLANEMRRAAALAESEVIGLEHLSPDLVDSGRAVGNTVSTATEPAVDVITVSMDQPLPDAVDELERAMITRTLDSVDGHMGFAAARLGISRKGLYLKRQRLALDGRV